METFEPFRSGRYAPFRWQQEDVKEWPWKWPDGVVTLSEPLCFFMNHVADTQPTLSVWAPASSGQVSKAHLELCIKPIGHDDGLHEPMALLVIIRGDTKLNGHVFDPQTIELEKQRNAVDFVFTTPTQRFVPTWTYERRGTDAALCRVYVPGEQE